MDRYHIKLKARGQISGKLGILFLCLFVFSVISSILNNVPLSPGTINIYTLDTINISINIYTLMASLFILPVLTIGFYSIYLDVARDVEPEVKNLFFYKKYFLKALGLNLLVRLIVFAGTILFVIPGIILSLSLSQVSYIFANNPDMKITDIISTSMSMMKGHKWEFFVLMLSFFGWFLLSVFTLGILTIVYVMPYFMTTTALYYLGFKDEYMKKMNNPNVAPILSSPEEENNNIPEDDSNASPWDIKY